MALNSKRKQVTLTLHEKREILEKIDRGIDSNVLMNYYKIGRTTLYNIKKQKEKLLKITLPSESMRRRYERRTLRGPKETDFDQTLYKWFSSKQSEGLPISGPMLIAKAKLLHKEMNIKTDMKFSQGWIRSFKSRHGIRLLKITGEQVSTDAQQAVSQCYETFSQILAEYSITPDEIYNAHETDICWKCLPINTLAGSDELKATGLKFNRERVTVLTCANVSGTHKLDLLVIGKFRRPQSLKGITHLPVSYKSSKNALMNPYLFTDWFFKNFVPSVQKEFHRLGKSSSKCLLLFNNSRFHTDESTLVSPCGNIFACYLPTNVISLIQPVDLGVIWSMRCLYKHDLMMKMVNSKVSPMEFQRSFTIKDAIYSLANAWNGIHSGTFKQAWENLYPHAMKLSENGNLKLEERNDSTVQKIIETAKLASENAYFELLDVEDVEMWIRQDTTNVKFCEEGNNDDPGINDSDSSLTVVEQSNEEISWVTAEKSMEMLIKFMEQNPYFNEDWVMQAHALQKQMLKQKLLNNKKREFCNRLRNAILVTGIPSEERKYSQEAHTVKK